MIHQAATHKVSVTSYRPAFNAKGEVIGIATAGVESAQGFNFFVPINTAWEFVRREGVTPDGGLFTPALAKGARSL